MNEKIIRNIALCYADTQKSQIEIMMNFAKLLIEQDMTKLEYLNDYLEAGLLLEESEPGVKPLLREVLEQNIEEPGMLLNFILNSKDIDDKNKAVHFIQCELVNRGYYEEKVVYNCRACGQAIPSHQIRNGVCSGCGDEIFKDINNLSRARVFKDYFAKENGSFFQEKAFVKQEKQPNKDQRDVSDDYVLPQPFIEKDKVLSSEDIDANPFFHKRHKS